MESDLMTFEGLNKWYCKVFEKLGWVVLASSEGHHMKVLEYHHSIKHLLASLATKTQNTADQDKRNDLQIMMQKVEHLRRHVESAMGQALQNALSQNPQLAQNLQNVLSQNPQLAQNLQSFAEMSPRLRQGGGSPLRGLMSGGPLAGVLSGGPSGGGPLVSPLGGILSGQNFGL
jgi:hypothetical protein